MGMLHLHTIGLGTSVIAILHQWLTVILVSDLSNISHHRPPAKSLPRAILFDDVIIGTVVSVDRHLLGIPQQEGILFLPQIRVQSLVQLGTRPGSLNGRQLVITETLASAVGRDDPCLVVAATSLREHFIVVYKFIYENAVV